MHISKFLLVAGVVGVFVAAVPVVAAPDDAAQAKMREALRHKMEEVNAQAAAPAPQTAPPAARPPTEVVSVEPAVVVAPAAVSGQSGGTFSEVPVVEGEDAQVARMQEAMRQQLAAGKAAAATVAATAPGDSAVKAATGPANVETIPSPFSTSKQMRLDELLRRYKVDEITPQEYHAQRAAIVAEP